MCVFHESLWCNLTPRYKCCSVTASGISLISYVNRLLLWWFKTCIIYICWCWMPFAIYAHFDNVVRSCCSAWWSTVLWITLSIRQSSANSFICLLILSVMSFIYNKKKVEPKTEPCGTSEIASEAEKMSHFQWFVESGCSKRTLTILKPFLWCRRIQFLTVIFYVEPYRMLLIDLIYLHLLEVCCLVLWQGHQ